MAPRRTGKSPAAKAKASAPSEASALAVHSATAKLTVSIKRRLSNGDEVFIAPGVEKQCSPDELDTVQAEVSERVHAWLDELLEAYPDADPIDEDEEGEYEDEDELEDEEADEDEDGEDDEDEEDLTEADIRKMKKGELQALAEEYEYELEAKTVKDMRDELIEVLFTEDEDEDGEDEEEDDEGEDEEAFDEEELSEMKLAQLQEIVDGWELEHPKFSKTAKLPAKKKAYIALILEAQEEE